MTALISAGWNKDRDEPSAKMELKILDDGSYDILYSDQIGLHSVQQSGGDVVARFVTEDTIVLVALYPLGSVETYLFSLKNREVIWTDIKWGGIAQLGRVMRAPCD